MPAPLTMTPALAQTHRYPLEDKLFLVEYQVM
jgi:hypothetical protein